MHLEKGGQNRPGCNNVPAIFQVARESGYRIILKDIHLKISNSTRTSKLLLNYKMWNLCSANKRRNSNDLNSLNLLPESSTESQIALS